MGPAGAARLAHHLHRGELDGAGAPYVEHLERVAALVASAGGGPRERMAAWLHGVARTGMRPRDLAALRVPHSVVQIVAALTPATPWESAAGRAERIRARPGAELIMRAVLADRYRPGAPADVDTVHADRDRELAAHLGHPLPAPLAEPAGRDTADALLSRLDPHDRRRWQAVRGLRAACEPRALRPLIDAYRAAKAGDRRWAPGEQHLAGAIFWIITHPERPEDPRRVRLLVSLADDGDAWLRAAGVRGLAGLGDAHQPLVVRALSDPSPAVAAAAVGALEPGRAGSVTEELSAIARRPGREWRWARRAAAHALAGAGDPLAHEVLLDVLAADGMALGVRFVADLAENLDGAWAVPRLTGLLRRDHGHEGVAFMLGEMRAREAVGDLCAVVADGRNVLNGIVALAKIGDPAALPTLIEAACHPDAPVRAAALTALTGFDTPQVVAEVALAATDDFDPGVRNRAVRLLAARGGREATSRLLMFRDGPLAPVVLRGLARIADERALPLLREVFLATADRRVRALAGRAIARSANGDPGLHAGDWMTLPQLRAAVWIHGETGSARSVRRLAMLLTHRDELVRARAATALGKIGDPAAADALKDAVTDLSPRVRASAATALGAVGVKKARTWLEPLRSDPRPDVRMAATAALRRLKRGS